MGMNDQGAEKEEENEDENQIELRMHSVIRLFKPENEVNIYHYTRTLSKALFYEQLYPQLFQNKDRHDPFYDSNSTLRTTQRTMTNGDDDQEEEKEKENA